jgi:hypothetical protein
LRFITYQFWWTFSNIKKDIGQAILVGKCCHCRINILFLICFAPNRFLIASP